MRDREVIVMGAPGAGWFADPLQRHQLRYWSGQEWTAHVSDNGQVGVDALFQAAAPQYQPQPQYQSQPQYQPQAQPQGWASAPALEQTAPAAAAAQVGVATIVGAALAGVGAVLNWMGQGDFTVGGFDVSVLFLVDYETDAEPGFAAGHLVILLAAALLVAAFVPLPSRRTIARIAGSGLVTIGALFLLQLQRATSSVDQSLSDYLQLGPFAVVAAGVLALVARGR